MWINYGVCHIFVLQSNFEIGEGKIKFEGGLIGIRLLTLVIPMIRYYNLWLFD